MPRKNINKYKAYQKAYQEEYRIKNKTMIAEKRKRWTEENPDYQKSESRIAYRRAYDSTAKAKLQRKLARQKLPKEKLQRREKKNRQLRQRILRRVKEHYQCQNPDCKWSGTLDAHCLDFHHLDPSTKFKEVSQIHSRLKLIKEMRKCTVLCAVCHRMEKWGDLDASNFPACKLKDTGEIDTDSV